MSDGVKVVRDRLKAVEMSFSRFVPGPLKSVYFLGIRYATFIAGGLIGWIILISSDQLLLRLGVWGGASYAAGLALAILFTFTYHRYITFDLRTELHERFIKFAPLQVSIAAANWVLFQGIKWHFGIPDISSASVVISFVITFVLSLVNFGANRLFIFHK